MNQRIDGCHNVQVGGNLVIGEHLDPNQPGLIECPSCSKLASRFAYACPRCGFPVAEFFATQEHDQVKRKFEKCALALLALGILLAGLGMFCFEQLRSPLTWVALVLVGFALMLHRLTVVR